MKKIVIGVFYIIKCISIYNNFIYWLLRYLNYNYEKNSHWRITVLFI